MRTSPLSKLAINGPPNPPQKMAVPTDARCSSCARRRSVPRARPRLPINVGRRGAIRAAPLAWFGDSPKKLSLHKLPGVKVVVPRYDPVGHCPVFEIKVRGVAAGDAPVRSHTSTVPRRLRTIPAGDRLMRSK